MLTEGLVGGLRINRTRGQEDQPSIDVRGAGHRCPRRDRHGRRCTAHCVGSTNRSDHRRSDPRTDAGVPGVAGRALVRDEEPGEDRRRRRVSGLARLRRGQVETSTSTNSASKNTRVLTSTLPHTPVRTESPSRRFPSPTSSCRLRSSTSVPEPPSTPTHCSTRQDILDWESLHGTIAPRSLVAMNSGWDTRAGAGGAFTNRDALGVQHTPGFNPEAIDFLVRERNIVAVGSDTLSIDAGRSTNPRGSPKRFGLRKVRSRSPRKSVRTSGRRRHGDGGSADACGRFRWSVPGHRLVLKIRAWASPAAPCRRRRCRWSPGASRRASGSPTASDRTGSPNPKVCASTERPSALRRRKISSLLLRPPITSAPSQAPHAAPPVKAALAVANVELPERHTAAIAPGTRTGSVIGTDSSYVPGSRSGR